MATVVPGPRIVEMQGPGVLYAERVTARPARSRDPVTIVTPAPQTTARGGCWIQPITPARPLPLRLRYRERCCSHEGYGGW